MTQEPLMPKHLSKQEFGRRVYKLMIGKGWNRSELGRRAGLPRDRTSAYVRGAALPTPENLAKLAKALDVDPADLLPNYTESAIEADHPALEMRVSPGASTKAWLRVNQLVAIGTATKIIAILSEDAAPDDAT